MDPRGDGDARRGGPVGTKKVAAAASARRAAASAMRPRMDSHGRAAAATDAPRTAPRTLADAMGAMSRRLCATVSVVPMSTQNCGNTADETSPTVT